MIWAVVVTKNRPLDLECCLSALAAQTRPPGRILVVDNAESGETPARATAPVEVLSTGRNSGSAGGQNLGWERAFGSGASAVWAMDDDCIPSPTALERLMDRLPAHPASVLNCLACDPHTGTMGPLVRTAPGIPKRPTGADVILQRENLPPSDIRDGIFWNWGHFFLGTLVPRAVFEKVGPVDARYFIRGEDYEYLLRCLRTSAVGIVMDSIMHHPMSHDRTNFGPKNLLEIRNHVAIDRKFFPGIRTSLPVMLAACLRDIRRHPSFARGILRAYWQGVEGGW